MAHRDCVIFVTHRWSDSVAGHYARLKREASPVLDVFLVYQGTAESVPAGVDPDVTVAVEEMEARFPQRFDQVRAEWAFQGAEMLWMTAATKPPIAGYDRVWSLEYDVDFSGDWATFFRAVADYEGDLLGLDLRYQSTTPQWPNAFDYVQPEGAPADPVIGFFPAVRASRRLIELYAQDPAREGWQGHFEIVLPSFALAKGLKVAELGGDSSFTPPERRGRHYIMPREVGHHAATFVFQPPRAFAYYEQSPRPFRRPDHLYHPIKTDLPLGQRMKFIQLGLGRRWVRLRNRLLGRTVRPQ